MKKIIAYLLFILFCNSLSAQKILSAKSKTYNFDYLPEYKRGMPPNLFVDLNFKDDNQNGILEARENGELTLVITNKGKGPAQGLVVDVKDNVSDENFQIDDHVEIYFIQPGESKNIKLPIKAGFNVKSAEHKLEIIVKEHFGYDMDPAYLILNTLEYQKPELVFSGIEIVDQGEETGAIKVDGQLQPGELVKAKIIVQNIGQNIAKNTSYKVESRDDNIYLTDNKGNLGNLGIGEVKEFWITISPNKRVDIKGKLPLYLTLEEKIGKGNLNYYQLPVFLNQEPPLANIEKVEADLDKLKKQVARFEYTSNKFKANVGSIMDIQLVSPSKTNRPGAVGVILGIEDYDNLPPAPYASNDAEIMKKYFKERLGIDQVVVYTNEQVSGFAFDDIFNPDYGELQKAVMKNKTDVFIFYSGHGLPSKDGENIYLFPSDGKVERLKAQGYNLNKLYESLEKLHAKSVTVFLDACFSGSAKSTDQIEPENLVAMKGIRLNPKLKKPWEKNENFSVFTSSAADETSLGFDPSGTGLFTYYLCAGMQGKADKNNDHEITLGELKSYVISNVTNTSVKIRGLQTPEFHGNETKVLLKY